MMAGRKLMEALIVYCKINVAQNIKEIKSSDEKKDYYALNAKDLENELSKNKKLIAMTTGEEGASSGSDSEPSADNLEEEEMAKIVPIKITKKPKKEEKKQPLPPPIKKPAIKKPSSPQNGKK